MRPRATRPAPTLLRWDSRIHGLPHDTNWAASLGFTGFPKRFHQIGTLPTAQTLGPFRVKLASVDCVGWSGPRSVQKTWVWKFPSDQNSSEGESYPISNKRDKCFKKGLTAIVVWGQLGAADSRWQALQLSRQDTKQEMS